AGQVLIYPMTDHPIAGYPSYADCGDHYPVDRDVDGIRWFADLYLGPEGNRFDPRFAPIRASTLVGLPPALVLTAEYDPLRDEGEAYAEALSKAGVKTVAERYSTVNHGFFLLLGLLPAADAALQLIASWLRSREARS